MRRGTDYRPPVWLILLWCVLLAWYGWVTVKLLVPSASAGGFYEVWFVWSLALWVVSGMWLVGTASGRVLDLVVIGALAALVAVLASTQNRMMTLRAGHLWVGEPTAMLVAFVVAPWIVTARVIYLLTVAKGR
jgi:hypothetical protein